MEPEPDTEEGVPPEALRRTPSAYQEYIKYGISAKGLRHVATEFQIGAGTTTSDLCQLFIKASTLPPGWKDEPDLVDAENRYYSHKYVKDHTAERVDLPPDGTRSMCEVLLENPDTQHFVSKPTHFLSHAWVFLFLNLLLGVEDFVSGLPDGEPEPFFWFDCFSLDQHAQSGQGSDWWRVTFLEAIGAIGHTVMMLSPWDNPTPLTRAWCLWELYCTHKSGATFSVCLGPDERKEFEEAILEDFDVVFKVFSKISVEKAKSGSESDEKMIKEVVAKEVGFSNLNGIAFARMRDWIFGVARSIAEKATEEGLDGLWKKRQVGVLFDKFGLPDEAERLYKEVIAGRTEHYGPNHV